MIDRGPLCPFVSNSLKIAGTTLLVQINKVARTASNLGNTLNTSKHSPNVCAASIISTYKNNLHIQKIFT